jgi:Uma2 family endonuclease
LWEKGFRDEGAKICQSISNSSYQGSAMVQVISRLLNFDEFLEQYPEDGKRYELIDGEIVEVRPVGDHEEIISLATR